MNYSGNRNDTRIQLLAAIFFMVMLTMLCISCTGGAKKEASVGQAAPDFTLEDLTGNQVSLSDFKGKVVVLNFWATWCPPCREEIPHMDALYQKYKDQGLVVIGVNPEKDREKVEKFAQAEMSYTVLLDAEGQQGREYGVTGIPCTFYIDKKGLLRHRDVGFGPGKEKEIEQKIVELLQ